MNSVSWKNLTNLTVSQSKIGNMGCKYISRLNMPIIKSVSLDNCVDSEGVLHLAKGQWKELLEIYLIKNFFKMECCSIFNKAKLQEYCVHQPMINFLSRVDDNRLNKEQLASIVLLQSNKLKVLSICKFALIYGRIRFKMKQRRQRQSSQYPRGSPA